MSKLSHLIGVDGARVTAVRSFDLFKVTIYGHGKVLESRIDEVTNKEYYIIGFSNGTVISSKDVEYVEELSKFIEWVGDRQVIVVPLTDYEVDASV